MLQYTEMKPRVHVETTVVSYLIARPSGNEVVESLQRATRQLWEEYSDNFEFVISDIVINEVGDGDEIAARHRLEMLTGLNVLDMPTEEVMLVQNLIVEVCRNAGFKPITLCTPTELIEEIHVKEKPDTRTDPVLEECYRIKEAFAAKFNSAQELYDYLKANQKKWKALGWKYVPLPQSHTKDNSNVKETLFSHGSIQHYPELHASH